VGPDVGVAVGVSELYTQAGSRDGLLDGTAVGDCDRVGLEVGTAVGYCERVGLEVGAAVGDCERVGLVDGAAVGEFVLSVGVAVGTATGAAVPESNRKVTGASVGDAVGASLGVYTSVRSQQGPTWRHPAAASFGMSTRPGHVSGSSSPALLWGP
jgi:hypothetical protein